MVHGSCRVFSNPATYKIEATSVRCFKTTAVTTLLKYVNYSLFYDPGSSYLFLFPVFVHTVFNKCSDKTIIKSL